MKLNNTKNHKSPLKKSAKSQKSSVENSGKKLKKSQKVLVGFGVLGLIGGACCLAASFLLPFDKKSEVIVAGPVVDDKKTANNIYSKLTGAPLSSVEEVTAPAYCIQTPNGVDGARPQAGLNEAGVVFEAVAEAGITRFAAIYQNPTAAVIGPIRSLRIYYLEWDTPFDCTIVHAGGSGDALAAVAHGYKDLTEDYSYMYRGTYGGRLWNNLFTTATDLRKMSTDRGYTSSNIDGFTRMTPEESLVSRIDALVEEKLVIYEPSSGKTSNLNASTSDIAINFGGYTTFNVRYNYDPAANKYLRSYATGTPHDVYNCPGNDLGEKNPEDVCQLEQMAPSVVVAMVVRESRAADNYHEDITTTGSGDVYVFQNGTATRGTWKKASAKEQIRFYDAKGTEIALAPGQTFVEAVPGYGSVEY
ncbi:MAG: DUF3048 domain-containing protein [Candidatus Saccharibacteria bacterium]|nr:DUF3048 domain-containing protein [Candidatus Saccharibacteria bacterium]